MRQVSIKNVRPGNIIGSTILSRQGRVLVHSGVALTPKIIDRLKELGISFVNIDDDLSKDVVLKEIVPFERRRQAMVVIEESGHDAKAGKEMDMSRLREIVGDIVDDILFEKDTLISLMDIRSYDTQVFAHAVSVCIMAVVIGKALGLKKDSLNILASGALLHDIGAVKLPVDLLRKREAFTKEENELYRTHTNEGFKILRGNRDLSLVTAHIAYQHHELLNGSGYPRCLRGTDKIHPLAQIVALVDFYDNLVNDGPGHRRMNPNEAVEIIMGGSGKLFPTEIVRTFLDHTEVFPTGCTVQLSNGDQGIVIGQNRSLPARPIVRVFPAGQRDNNKTLDLTEHLTLFITEIIN